MTRREAREHCFKMLFCQDFYPAEEKEAQLEQYFEAPEEEESGETGKEEILHQVEMGEEDRKMLEERVERIMARIPEIDSKIDAVAEGWKTRRMSKGWKTSRMGKVDLSILRLAVYEILFDEDVPTGVAINEAVELAKKFGGKDAPSFVNGILARLVDKE